MPYYTGTATSAADLITAICNAATANGWTLSSTGIILSKGDIYAQLSEWNPRDDTITDKGIGVQAGLGESSGVLTDPCLNISGIRADYDQSLARVQKPVSYPLTYYIFINTSPDEIVVAVNFDTVWWSWLAFGQANTIGVTGTGVYSWSMKTSCQTAWYQVGINVDVSAYRYDRYPCFYNVMDDNYVLTTYESSSHIHLALDGLDWWNNTLARTEKVSCFDPVGDILKKQPNTWNNEALLVRTQILAERAESFWSYVAEFPHFRWIRNTYIDDATVITLGTDDWFVAPVLKKDLEQPDGATTYNNEHSGTIGFAVRKTA